MRKGFTLIELTMALTVMAVLAGMVVVRVDGWSSRQALHGSARTLGTLIRTWREKAELEERPYAVTLDPDKGIYRIDDPLRLGFGGELEKLREGRLKAGQAFARLEVSGVEWKGPLRLSLAPHGILPDIQLILTNEDKVRVRITLRSLTNDVDYQEIRE